MVTVIVMWKVRQYMRNISLTICCQNIDLGRKFTPIHAHNLFKKKPQHIISTNVNSKRNLKYNDKYIHVYWRASTDPLVNLIYFKIVANILINV